MHFSINAANWKLHRTLFRNLQRDLQSDTQETCNETCCVGVNLIAQYSVFRASLQMLFTLKYKVLQVREEYTWDYKNYFAVSIPLDSVKCFLTSLDKIFLKNTYTLVSR